MILTPQHDFSPEKNSGLLDYLNNVSGRLSIDLYDFNDIYGDVSFKGEACFTDFGHLNEAESDLLSSRERLIVTNY